MEEGRELAVLPGGFAICRLPGDESPSGEGGAGDGLWAIVRTPDELSLVCSEESIPDGAEASRGWRALRVTGALDLSLTGVLVALLDPLKQAEIPIFAISTFDTDYVLVPGDRLEEAKSALAAAGHAVR